MQLYHASTQEDYFSSSTQQSINHVRPTKDKGTDSTLRSLFMLKNITVCGVLREPIAGIGDRFGEDSEFGGRFIREGLYELKRHQPPYLYNNGPSKKGIPN